jgi:hypothetical protein
LLPGAPDQAGGGYAGHRRSIGFGPPAAQDAHRLWRAITSGVGLAEIVLLERATAFG